MSRQPTPTPTAPAASLPSVIDSAPAPTRSTKFKTAAILLIVAIAIVFLVRTFLAMRKKNTIKTDIRENETKQWQSFFSAAPDIRERPAPPVVPSMRPPPAVHTAHAAPGIPVQHHPRAPEALGSRLTADVTTGGQAIRMPAEMTRPSREPAMIDLPPSDVKPAEPHDKEPVSTKEAADDDFTPL